MNGYHPGGSLVFDRLSDGSVVMARVHRKLNGVEETRFSFVFGPDVWAGLIAYVADTVPPIGEKGENDMARIDERTEKARQFHKGNYQENKTAG